MYGLYGCMDEAEAKDFGVYRYVTPAGELVVNLQADLAKWRPFGTCLLREEMKRREEPCASMAWAPSAMGVSARSSVKLDMRRRGAV